MKFPLSLIEMGMEYNTQEMLLLLSDLTSNFIYQSVQTLLLSPRKFIIVEWQIPSWKSYLFKLKVTPIQALNVKFLHSILGLEGQVWLHQPRDFRPGSSMPLFMICAQGLSIFILSLLRDFSMLIDVRHFLVVEQIAILFACTKCNLHDSFIVLF